MRNRLPAFLQLERYNISPEDVVRVFLRCAPDDIQAKVVITPIWGAPIFQPHVDTLTTVSNGLVWHLQYHGTPVTVIRSGLGAPQTGDIVLALGCTRCETLVFSGSVGGLDAAMGIGDLVVVDQSVCGDGFSRYVSPAVIPQDCFLHAVAPDPGLTHRLTAVARAHCAPSAIPLHQGKVFCIDSILTQFFRLDWVAQQYACIGIEMETSATFKAASLVEIKASALLQVSDVLPTKKSFFSGRSEQENDQRKRIRAEILPKIVLDLLVKEAP
jgi:purine-nucleoside phosphorylase